MSDWNLRIHWNPLCKRIRHLISRFSSGFVCMSTSPSPDRRSDPSGETTINGVPSFLWHTHCTVYTYLTKNVRSGKKTGIIFPTIVATTLISFALPYCIASFGGISFSHSQMCAQTRRKRVAHIFSFLKSTSCIFLNIFFIQYTN